MKVMNMDTLFIITMAGVYLNLAYELGTDNPIVQRRAWENKVKEECDDTSTSRNL